MMEYSEDDDCNDDDDDDGTDDIDAFYLIPVVCCAYESK